MIYVDFSHLATSCYFAHDREVGSVDEGDFRKHIIHTLMQVNARFKHTYGKMILCCDGKKAWRYEVYTHYKALRKMNRADDAVQWQEIGRLTRLIRDEIDQNKVFKVVQVASAEGDDVIAILSANILEPSVIVSEDKDFHQLHKYPHISQFSHRRGTIYRSFTPDEDLKIKIITGDRNDSIPNIHSKDEVFVLRERQNVVSAKRKAHYNENFFIGSDGIPEEYAKHFERNRTLIDFDCIPERVKQDVITSFNNMGDPGLFAAGTRTQYLMQAGINPSSF